MLPNPNKAAMMAIIKKTIAQLNWPCLEIIIKYLCLKAIYRSGVIFCTTLNIFKFRKLRKGHGISKKSKPKGN